MRGKTYIWKILTALCITKPKMRKKKTSTTSKISDLHDRES